MKKKNNLTGISDDSDHENDFESIGITDNFMFSSVFEKNKELCKRLLESILGFVLDVLNYAEREKTISADNKSKGVRLDIIARATGRVYNIEMQNSKVDDIPRRIRYYQPLLDIEMLHAGDTYSDLKDAYVIFICRFDQFGRGKYVYRYSTNDEEDGYPFGDGAKKIVVNASGDHGEITQELREFIDYINDPGTIEELSQSNWVRQVDERVKFNRHSAEWRKDYMSFEVILQDKFKEGKAEGKAEGIDMARKVYQHYYAGEDVRKIASDLGYSEDEVKRILELK